MSVGVFNHTLRGRTTSVHYMDSCMIVYISRVSVYVNCDFQSLQRYSLVQTAYCRTCVGCRRNQHHTQMATCRYGCGYVQWDFKRFPKCRFSVVLNCSRNIVACLRECNGPNIKSTLLIEILSTYCKGKHSPPVMHKGMYDKSTFSGEK